MKLRILCCAAALVGVAGCASHPAEQTSVAVASPAAAKPQLVHAAPTAQPATSVPTQPQAKGKKTAAENTKKESAAEFEARVDAWIRGAATGAPKKS